MQSLKGRLLIAGPTLWDTNFRRTVVLVAEHDENGAVGVILNRPSGDTVRDAVPDLGWMVPFDDQVFLGGPVQPERVVILGEFTEPLPTGVGAFGTIGFLTGEFTVDEARTLLRARLLAGYAVWGPGDLEAQVEGARAWLPEWPVADDVFHDDPDTLWDRVVARMGGEIAFLRPLGYEPVLN